MNTMTIGQLKKLLELQEQVEMDPERFQKLLGWILADTFDPDADFPNRDAFRKAIGLEPIVNPEMFEFVIDFTCPLKSVLVLAGCKVSIEKEHIQSKFPIVGSGVVTFEARLMPARRLHKPEALLEKVRRLDESNPWSPGKFEHLITFATKYPGPRRFPVYALGSMYHVANWPFSCPILTQLSADHGEVFTHNLSIHNSCRLLIVREKKSL
jgi:hypothetical protein